MENLELALGSERFRSDRRQLGGLLLVIGGFITFQPLDGIATLIHLKQDASEDNFDTMWLIFCGSIQMIFGTLAMVVGYLALVQDCGNYRLTGALMLATHLSWIPYLTGIIQVGVAAGPPYSIETRRSTTDGILLLEEYVSNPFIPESYTPTKNDVIFIGSMGILGLMSYGIGFFGSLSFLGYALYSFDVGKPTRRDARYYRGRLIVYSFVMLIAGMSQILLGAYILFEFGGGRLSPPIGVTLFIVSFPEICVAVGSIQMIVGYYGVGNYLHLFPADPSNNTFQILALIGWILQLIFQYIVQISYSEDADAAALTSLALYSFGINILPPFLDYKMRTTPITLKTDHYSTLSTDDKTSMEKVSALPERNESVSFAENSNSFEKKNESERNSWLVRATSESTGVEGESTMHNSKCVHSRPDTQSSDRIRSRGMFPRLFSRSRTQKLKQGDRNGNDHTDELEKTKAVANVDTAVLNVSIGGSGNTINEYSITCEKMTRDEKSFIGVNMMSTKSPSESTTDSKQPMEHSGEPKQAGGMGLEPPHEYELSVQGKKFDPDKSEISSNNMMAHSPEPGIVVKECVEHPDDIAQDALLMWRTTEDIKDVNNVSDQDTPPRSNESFSTDMNDTWGDQSLQQTLFSPITNKNFNRIPIQEKIGNKVPSPCRDTVIPSHCLNEEELLPSYESTSEKKLDQSSSILHHHTSDSYYDYDSDKEFEISEATPDDDTAQLDAKIDKLKGELLSDINLESYLNQIL
eukprot:CAMPEP_0197188390 /NCGR_PEP_ID=MMETSP1423-20130617/17708_1 /TAXON_ID=476441 /ORGANISM="Pseudo-nitzschia heimii, Strain UNC1101" /LENGTH=749 /DNA_ID=CAMNT_0042640199 /DNA_START=73 /DNA_END=2322 /DNA_ORIENTATION=-